MDEAILVKKEGIPVNVHVRRNADGAMRIYQFLQHGWGFEADEFLWSDGNYSCDCNRALFFARAIEQEDEAVHPCGETAFSVRIFDMSGKLLYEDGDWKESPPILEE